MASIFISYSRSDKALIQTLTAALKAAKRDYWLDENDIPPSAAWAKEIQDNIALADTFLYILSPDSIAPTSGCASEVEDALRDAKRIVPLVCREVEAKQVRPEVAALNWIFCRPGDDFDAAFAKLLEALDTDLEYWHEAAQYLVRARQWEAKQENASFALRGSDLAEAEVWLAKGVAKKPAPTPLHVQYITASRRTAQRQQRRTISFLSVVSVVMAALAVAALLFFNQARLQSIRATQQRNTAVFRQLVASSAANLDTAPDLALLDAIEAARFRNTLDARTALYTALDQSAYLAAELQNGDAETGFEGITNVAFSTDGQTLMSADDKGVGTNGMTQITLWNVATRQPRLRFTIPHGIFSAALSPDGRIVATGDYEGPLELWDATTGARLVQLGQAYEDPHGLAFSPDSSLLASYDCTDTTCQNRHITLWNVAARSAARYLLVNNNGGTIAQAFSPDGKYLAVSVCADILCTDHQFILWNIAAAKAAFNYTGVIQTFAFSANGKTLALGGCASLAACSSQGQVLLVDVTSGTFIGAPLTDSGGTIYEVALSPDGQTLVTAAAHQNALHVWNLTSRTSTQIFGHTDSISDLAFSADGKYFASGGVDNRVLLWRTTPFSPLSHLLSTTFDGASVAAFSPDGKTLATGNCQGQITLWDTTTGAQASMLNTRLATNLLNCITYMAFSPDGKRLAASTTVGLFIADLTSRQRLVFTMNGNPGIVVHSSMTFSADGRYLVTTHHDGNHTVWDTNSGTPFQRFPAGPTSNTSAFYTGAAFSAEGALLALGQHGNEVTLVDGHTFSAVATLHGPSAPDAYVAQVAFSRDSKTLAALSSTGRITLWQVSTRTLIGSFQALTTTNVSAQLYTCLAFSPDGKELAANLGQTFGVWYTATHEPVMAPQQAGTDVRNMAFSPDGRLLAEATSDDALFVRYATLPLWQAQACAIANRNFTHAEWQQVFDIDPYQKVCSNLPAPLSS